MKFITILGLFFLSISLSCKQSEGQVFTDPTKYFSIPTDMKHWKNLKETNVNDSIKKVSGDFKNYKIEGFVNSENQKINWWKIVNTNSSTTDKNVRLEYRIIDDKEYVNQFIYYNSRGENYVDNSMFFSKQILEKNNFVYKFYTPTKKILK